MKDLSEISDYSQHKTRVLIYSSHLRIAELVLYVLDFFGKEVGYFLETGRTKKAESDFVILETSDFRVASDFKGNIVLVPEEINGENISPVLKNITPGGVLIYPNRIEQVVERSENFFRRLPFLDTEFKSIDGKLVINTEIGSIPLVSGDENLDKNINGIKLLCQQFGIMEEDFYEALMGFE